MARMTIEEIDAAERLIRSTLNLVGTEHDISAAMVALSNLAQQADEGASGSF